MVPSSGGFQPSGSDLAPSPSGHVCNKVQLQTSPIHVSSAGPQCVGSGRSNNLLGKPGHVCLSSSGFARQGGQQDVRPSILIAPGWPNLPSFWGPVELSSQIPLCLPNHPDFVTQPFNKARHRNLTNLNLHAWLLELKQSRSKVSLVQWRHKLRLLKEVQPEQSMRRSGPFLSDGVKQVRWTSDLHLSNT